MVLEGIGVVDMESDAVLLCKNETCVQPVPPSKNPGRPRVFCSYRCKNQHFVRQGYRREKGTTGDGLYTTINGRPTVSRIKAPTAKAAEARYKMHLTDCAISTDQYKRCPSRLDPYGRKRLCLIMVVLREDWDELRRAEAGHDWERQLTTSSGQWKEVVSE